MPCGAGPCSTIQLDASRKPADDLRLLLSLLEMIGQQERTEDKPDLSMVLPMALRDPLLCRVLCEHVGPTGAATGAPCLPASWRQAGAAHKARCPPTAPLGLSATATVPGAGDRWRRGPQSRVTLWRGWGVVPLRAGAPGGAAAQHVAAGLGQQGLGPGVPQLGGAQDAA